MKPLNPSLRMLLATTLVLVGVMSAAMPAVFANESNATLLSGPAKTIGLDAPQEEKTTVPPCAPLSDDEVGILGDEAVAYDEQHGDCTCTYVYRQYTEWFRCAGQLQCRSDEWDGSVVFYRMARVVKVLHDCFDDQYCGTNYGSPTCTYYRCP